MDTRQPLSGIFIILFLFCAIVFSLTGAVEARSDTGALRSDNALNGRWASTYEAAFNKTVDLYQPSIVTWGVLNYLLFDEGKEGVLIGDDGWLFTKEEFDYTPDHDAQIEKNLAYIKTVHDLLAARNIKMVVALVPAKSRVYQEALGRYTFPSYQKNTYSHALQDLGRSGIAVADIYSAMRNKEKAQRLFLKTDTHWTPKGAEIAAETIGQEIKREWPDLRFDGSLYKTIRSAPVRHEGDLMRYIPLGPLAGRFGPAPDQLVSVKTEKVADPDKPAPVEENALFDDENIPVALVGTSYSANPRWNFDGFLRETLHTDVLNAADEGKGPFETMKEYLVNDSFLHNPPELIVWEIPERYLPVSYHLTAP